MWEPRHLDLPAVFCVHQVDLERECPTCSPDNLLVPGWPGPYPVALVRAYREARLQSLQALRDETTRRIASAELSQRRIAS